MNMKKHMENYKLSILIAIFSGVLWAIDSLMMSNTVESNHNLFFNVLFIAFLHDVFFTLYSIIYLNRKGNIQYNLYNHLNLIKSLEKKYLLVILGVMCGPIATVCYLLSIDYGNISQTSIISTTYPIFTFLLAIVFLKEKVNYKKLIGFIIIMASIININFNKNIEVSYMSLILVIISAMCWGGESVIASYIFKEKMSYDIVLSIRQIFSTIGYIVIISLTYSQIKIIPTADILSILLSALFGFVSYLFYYRSIYKLGSIVATSFNMCYSLWIVIYVSMLSKSFDGLLFLTAVTIILGFILLGDKNEN